MKELELPLRQGNVAKEGNCTTSFKCNRHQTLFTVNSEQTKMWRHLGVEQQLSWCEGLSGIFYDCPDVRSKHRTQSWFMALHLTH